MSAVLTPPLPAATPPPQPATGPQPWKWTRADLIRLYELGFFAGHRVMLIEGEVLAMSPMNEPHARGIVFAGEALQAAFGTGYTFRTQMPMDLGQTTDPEPDLAVLLGSPRSQPTTPPTTAVLVVEVADTSLTYDMGDKASLYAAAGIADYWVLDLSGRRLHVFRDPRPDAARRFGHGYFQQTMYGPADRVSPLAAPTSSILVGDLLP
jgi:Uma2 family endonuclease